MHIGKTIKSLRTLRGMQQQELAMQLGISGTYLSQIENDKKKPSPHLIVEIAKTLRISPGEILIYSLSKEMRGNADTKSAIKIMNNLIEYITTK